MWRAHWHFKFKAYSKIEFKINVHEIIKAFSFFLIMVVNLNLGCCHVHKITQMHFFGWNLKLMEISQWQIFFKEVFGATYS